jgi:hypothetical protein
MLLFVDVKACRRAGEAVVACRPRAANIGGRRSGGVYLLHLQLFSPRSY